MNKGDLKVEKFSFVIRDMLKISITFFVHQLSGRLEFYFELPFSRYSKELNFHLFKSCGFSFNFVLAV